MTPKLSLMRALFPTQVKYSCLFKVPRIAVPKHMYCITGVMEACVQDVQLHSQFFPDHRLNVYVKCILLIQKYRTDLMKELSAIGNINRLCQM